MSINVSEFCLAAEQTNYFDAVLIQNRKALESTSCPNKLAKIAASVAHLLPEAIRDQIKDYQTGKTQILIIKGSKVIEEGNQVPNTPNAFPHPDVVKPLLFRAALGLMNGLVRSKPLINKDGSMQVNHVIPRAPRADFQVNSSAVDLDFHTDGMRRIEIPKSIALYCIRPQEGANTYFISTAKVLDRLDHDTLAALREPKYSLENVDLLANGAAFGTRHRHTISLPYAILDDDSVLRYSQESTGIDERSSRALSNLREAIYAEERFVASLDKGDLLLFRNDRTLHGRSTFPFEQDPAQRRWVLRQTSDLPTATAIIK